MKEEHLETQRAEGATVAQRVVENLDLMAAGLAAFLFALHFLGWLFPVPQGSTETLRQLAQAKDSVERTLNNSGYDVDKARDDADALVKKVRASWGPIAGKVPEVRPAFTWPVALVEALRKGEPNEISFPAPEDVRAEAEAGFIRVSWLISEKNNVPISGFVILRVDPPGGFKEIARVPRDTTRYEDRHVQPGASHTYRIVGLTEDPIVKAQVERSPESAPATVQALADYRITLVDADVAKQTAMIQVEKWKDGSWWPKRFTMAVGQSIGELDPGSGVDYTTGRTLGSLSAETKSEARVRKEVIFDGDGRVRTEGGEPVTEEVEVNESFLEITAHVRGGPIPAESLRLEKR